MTVAGRRAPRPDDLYRFRLATHPRLAPTGDLAAFVVQTTAPRFDGYRQAIWLVPVDRSGPARQATLGARHDTAPAFSPDGRTIAFLSDRRSLIEEGPEPGGTPTDRDDRIQVYLLPLDGGEARRLTDLPGGVTDLAWSPDGRFLVVTSPSRSGKTDAEHRRQGRVTGSGPGEPPPSDLRSVDRLRYQHNGKGFVYDRVEHLWLVDVASKETSRLTTGSTREAEPAWSPDGSRIAFVTELGRDSDIAERTHIVVVDLATRVVTPLVGGEDARFSAPAWLPDGSTVVALGGRVPQQSYRNDIWLLAADGTGARGRAERNLSGRHDLMPGSSMNSDITIGERTRVVPSADGEWITFSAPCRGSYELFRIAVADGTLDQLTRSRHSVSAFDQVSLPGGGTRIAALISTPTRSPDLHLLDVPEPGAQRGAAPVDSVQLSALNESLLAELALVEPVQRSVRVDGREIHGWLIPAAARGEPGAPPPLVTEIHGGPHTLYGWSPMFEFQVLAGEGISVFACNPRGSEGYGRDFCEANLRDWGPGPMRDVLAGVDALVADGLADPDRLGVTGGSYGGYLTNWIVAHDQRFKAAVTCRSVSDMTIIHLTGDLSSGDWPLREFGVVPWDDWAYFREISPITYAQAIRTPLLIQHAEQDLRCTITQAEALFTVLRSLRRPVRLLRIPGESHELTRSGTPFRRVEHLAQVRNWFVHYLVKGRRNLPPLPKARARARART